jgi:hypothetical protein
MSDNTTPMGIKEIAERAQVKEVTVRAWVDRHPPGSRTPFPTARWTVSGRDAYDWSDVRDWLQTTGRLVSITEFTPARRVTEHATDDAPADAEPTIRAALSSTAWDVSYRDGCWYLRLPNATPIRDRRADLMEEPRYQTPEGSTEAEDRATGQWRRDHRRALDAAARLRAAGMGLLGTTAQSAIDLANGEAVELIVPEKGEDLD